MRLHRLINDGYDVEESGVSQVKIAVYHSEKLNEYLGLFDGRVPDDWIMPIHSKNDLASVLPEAEVLVANNAFPFAELPTATNLKWVQVMAAGVDPWLPHLPEHVRVSRVTGSFGPRMAEFAIGYLFAITQRMPEVFAQQSRREWRTLDLDVLAGKTLGVAGLGSIGGSVADLGKRVGLRVVGMSNNRPEAVQLDAWYPSSDLHSFLGELDFLVLTLPLTSSTRKLVDAAALQAMKPGAWLLNMARGPIVDEQALISSLQNGHPGGAVLDVFETEPLPEDNPLWTMPNVIVASHQSGSTVPADVVDVFEENIRRYQQGDTLLHEVDRSRGY
jgi:phosphoglycerate dehydrogenase-like enzyme